MKILFSFFFCFLISVSSACAEDLVITSEVVFQHGLMGFAGIIIAGLFWLGVIINL